VTSVAARAFALLRAGYGAVLLCAPGAVIGLCTGQPASKLDRAVTRVLGARQLGQAALTARSPTSMVLGIGALIDLAHATSMLALAAGDRPLRRAGLTDGLTASAFAAVGAIAAQSGKSASGAPRETR
jgi:hypothetical protein